MAFNLMWKNELKKKCQECLELCKCGIVAKGSSAQECSFSEQVAVFGIMLCGEGQDLFITLELGSGSRFNKFFKNQFMFNRDFGHLGVCINIS